MSQLIAGIVGVVLGALVTSYLGPRFLEDWREKRREAKDRPRREMLKEMLEDERFRDGRTLERLCIATGTTPEDCRRLLIEIGGRGVTLRDGVEGWALRSRKPLDQQ